MINILKKNWFVVLVAIILVGFSVFCIYDTNKGKLPGKSVDGKDVVAALGDDVNVTADELYEKLYESGGENLVYLKFQAAVIDESVKMTDEIKDYAKQLEEYVTSTSQSSYSSYGYANAEEYLKSMLGQYGYGADELEKFCRIQSKMNTLQKEYVEKNMKELLSPLYKENKGRTVSHILVKMEDAKNPTAEEKKTVEAIEKDLKTMSFEEVAKKYKDKGDTASAENGGYLGYMDNKTSYVESFKKQALSMKAGEVSDWVKESNDNYNGWHMIKVHDTELDKILKDEKAKDSITQTIVNNDSKLTAKFVKEAADKLKIEYANDDIKAYIEKSLDTKEDSEE